MRPRIVGVIASRADLRRALRMRTPPDFFELRLDRLIDCRGDVTAAISRLSAPFIITARHSREGGANHLSARQRRALLLEFLPHAAYIDLELRSAAGFDEVRRSANTAGVGLIISIHDLARTPPLPRLENLAVRARSLGADFIKIATRTDTPAQLDRLLAFFDGQRDPALAVMGIGKRGPASRLALIRRGCPLNYAHLGSPAAAGQMSVPQLRRAMR